MRRLGLIIAIVLGCFASPAMSQMVVIATSGDAGLHPGDRLDPAMRITLPEGARITLLTKTGIMRVIDGPYLGTLGSQDDIQRDVPAVTQWDAIKTFIGDPDARSDVVGAMRTAKGDLLVPPSIWHVSVDSSGPRCTPFSKLVLWRRKAALAPTVSVRGEAGRLTDLVWAKGENTLALPKAFAAKDGPLIVSLNGNLRELSIKVLPQTLEDAAPGALLGWLVDNKCSRQALALIARVHAKAAIR